MNVVLVERRVDGRERQRWLISGRKMCLIGRMPGLADIVVPHPSMSRRHASLTVYESSDKSVVDVEDQNSANGTFIDGVRITGRHTIELNLHENCANAGYDSLDSLQSKDVEISFAQNPCKYFVICDQCIVPKKQRDLNESPSLSVQHTESQEPRPPTSRKAQGLDHNSTQNGNKALSRYDKNNLSCTVEEFDEAGAFKEKRKKFISKWDPTPDESANSSETGSSVSSVLQGYSMNPARTIAARKAHDAAAEAVKRLHEKSSSETCQVSEDLKEKKRLLWGGSGNGGEICKETERSAPAKDERAALTLSGATYHSSFTENKAKRAKFLSLLGDKDSEFNESKIPKTAEKFVSKQTEVSLDLELEYMKGLRRKDGRKDGLGAGH